VLKGMVKERTVINTKKLVITAMFTALIALATIVVQIPIPIGYVNLGDMFVLLSAFVLGAGYGCVAAGIGSSIADIIVCYAIYAPATFIIKACMAIVASVIFNLLSKKLKYKPLSMIVAGVIAELIMVVGYFFYEAVILGYSWSALYSIPGNLIQGAVGIVVCITIMSVFNNRNLFVSEKNKNDSDKEKQE
jgi:uncharacterized membrane protein